MNEPRNGIAVVGMSCIFPGAGDLHAFERNLAAGVDAITEAPDERIPPEFYDPDSDEIDRVYCRRGGFIDEHARFDPVEWGLMPVAARGSEPDQLLTLRVAGGALADAGYDGRAFSRESTGVILGRGGYLNPRMLSLTQAVRTSHELAVSLQRSVPGVSPETVDEVRRDYRSRIEGLGPDTIIGVTPNLAASRVANRLDLKGPAYTVDAACASSLIAVDQARMELLAGRMDMVLVGGVHVCHDPGFWSVFCQIGALSREQRIRPFHREADGLLMGEGVGVVVLKRLADAIADDDRIYAVLRGSGTSSDGRASSVLSPRSESQALAIERAWREARLDPAEPGSVGLIEAHGTATPAGDATELETLARVFGPPVEGPAPGLGSVKSMIGHAMPAAGIAGFIKAVLALHNRRLYPTLHCEEPNPAIGDTRFRIVTETEAWEADGSPRRAGVNAFGFGGVNAHVILEEPPRPPRARRSTVRETETVLLAAASTPAALVEAVEAGRSPDGGACRLAVVDPTPERMEEALAVARRGEPFRDRRGHVWFSPRGLASSGGEIAFLFPGIEGRVHGSLDDVAERFDKPRLRQADRSAAELEETSFQLVWAHRLFHEVLTEAGIRPAALAGHSLGEWSAMLAGGAIGQGTLERLFDTLHPGTMTIPGLAFAAAGVGAEEALARLEGVPDVHVSHDNCPHQSVLCGPAEQIDEAIAQLRDGGVLCQRLSFQSGFHTPHFERHVESIRPVIRDLPLEVPETSVWSATTARRFPDDEERIRELMLEHLLRPVRFRELVEALHRSGIRGFVQIGLGSLIGFVDDTLKDRPHFALPSYDPRRGGLAQLRRLAAALWVEGVEFDVSALVDRVVDRIPGPDRGNEGPRLVLSAPYVYARHPIDPGATPAEPLPPEARSDPVLGRFLETQEMLEESRRRVLQAWREARETTAPRRSSTTRRLSLEEQPYLVDHSFFDLPDGWPHPTDGFPLVPLTMSISMMIDAARDLVPGRIVTGVEDVRAYRWIAVEEPVDVVIEAEYDGASRVETLVRDADEGTAYAKCTVRIADLYDPAPPAGALDDAEERPPPMTATEMYESRHMFHGPAYRSVTGLDAISDETIRGRITRLPAEGSLLDAAGQLLGLWITRMAEDNQVSVPVIVDRVAFHGPEPDVGVELDCTVRVRHFGARQVRSDMEIAAGGQVWAEITGWQDRRTETEGWMWPMILSADEHTLARPHPDLPDGCWTPEPVDRPSAMEYFARRYLDGEEIETYRSLGPRRKAGWLNGRIAAKDAVRRWHWERGGGPTYPIEVRIDGGGDRPPEVRFDPVPDLRLSIAHKGPVAAAIVAEGRAVGLDLERIEPRHEGFDEVAFGAPERDLLPAGGDRDEWRARFWAAKEALAKMRGTGLRGNPRAFPVTGTDGETVTVDGTPVETRRRDEWIVAWTEEDA